MAAYYNEIDPYAAQWLRNLITAGHIAPGDVDERSIVDVRGDDLRGYSQCHFFAGIGGWSAALRLAGWDDARPVWTGSCPCQPFSAAGAGKAADDERHLWPAWFPLIAQRRPAIVFGEQVEAAIGWGWLDAVFADLEGEGYACGTTVLPACGVGAPHIRQRVWFVADAERGGVRIEPGSPDGSAQEVRREVGQQRIRADVLASSNGACTVAHTDGWDASTEGLQRSGEHGQRAEDGRVDPLALAAAERRSGRTGHSEGQRAAEQRHGDGRQYDDLGDAAGGGQREFGDAMEPRRGGHPDRAGEFGGLGNTERRGREGRGIASGWPQASVAADANSPLRGFWSDAEWIACTDGKARPVGPGSFPLGHGIRNRTSKLRAYGNAIVPQVAAEFIIAAQEAITENTP